MSSVPDTWESQSSPSYSVKHVVISVALTACGIDIIGKIRPNASNMHKYIVVAIDYFSRGIET